MYEAAYRRYSLSSVLLRDETQESDSWYETRHLPAVLPAAGLENTNSGPSAGGAFHAQSQSHSHSTSGESSRQSHGGSRSGSHSGSRHGSHLSQLDQQAHIHGHGHGRSRSQRGSREYDKTPISVTTTPFQAPGSESKQQDQEQRFFT